VIICKHPLSRDPSFLKIDQFVRHGAQIGLQLDDLHRCLANLIGSTRDRRDVFAAFALQTRHLALQCQKKAVVAFFEPG
jgi:hypothetical protein